MRHSLGHRQKIYSVTARSTVPLPLGHTDCHVRAMPKQPTADSIVIQGHTPTTFCRRGKGNSRWQVR